MKGAELLLLFATLFSSFSMANENDGGGVSLTWSESKSQWCANHRSKEICLPPSLSIVSVTNGITRMGVPLGSSAPFMALYIYSSKQEILRLESHYAESHGDDHILFDEGGIPVRVYRMRDFYAGVVSISSGLVFLVSADSLDDVDAVASSIAKQWVSVPGEESDSGRNDVLPCDQIFHASCKQ